MCLGHVAHHADQFVAIVKPPDACIVVTQFAGNLEIVFEGVHIALRKRPRQRVDQHRADIGRQDVGRVSAQEMFRRNVKICAAPGSVVEDRTGGIKPEIEVWQCLKYGIQFCRLVLRRTEPLGDTRFRHSELCHVTADAEYAFDIAVNNQRAFGAEKIVAPLAHRHCHFQRPTLPATHHLLVMRAQAFHRLGLMQSGIGRAENLRRWRAEHVAQRLVHQDIAPIAILSEYHIRAQVDDGFEIGERAQAFIV